MVPSTGVKEGLKEGLEEDMVDVTTGVVTVTVVVDSVGPGKSVVGESSAARPDWGPRDCRC